MTSLPPRSPRHNTIWRYNLTRMYCNTWYSSLLPLTHAPIWLPRKKHKTSLKFSTLYTKITILPQKSIWVRRKPSTSKCSPAITRFKPGLNPNKPKKLRPVNQCSVIITSGSTRTRIKCSKSVLGSATAKNRNRFGSAERWDSEDCARKSNEKGDEWKDQKR